MVPTASVYHPQSTTMPYQPVVDAPNQQPTIPSSIPIPTSDNNIHTKTDPTTTTTYEPVSSAVHPFSNIPTNMIPLSNYSMSQPPMTSARPPHLNMHQSQHEQTNPSLISQSQSMQPSGMYATSAPSASYTTMQPSYHGYTHSPHGYMPHSHYPSNYSAYHHTTDPSSVSYMYHPPPHPPPPSSQYAPSSHPPAPQRLSGRCPVCSNVFAYESISLDVLCPFCQSGIRVQPLLPSSNPSSLPPSASQASLTGSSSSPGSGSGSGSANSGNSSYALPTLPPEQSTTPTMTNATTTTTSTNQPMIINTNAHPMSHSINHSMNHSPSAGTYYTTSHPHSHPQYPQSYPPPHSSMPLSMSMSLVHHLHQHPHHSHPYSHHPMRPPSAPTEEYYYNLLSTYTIDFETTPHSALIWLSRATPSRSYKLAVPRKFRLPKSVAGQGGYSIAFIELGLTLREADTSTGHWHSWYAQPHRVDLKALQLAILRRWQESRRYRMKGNSEDESEKSGHKLLNDSTHTIMATTGVSSGGGGGGGGATITVIDDLDTTDVDDTSSKKVASSKENSPLVQPTSVSEMTAGSMSASSSIALSPKLSSSKKRKLDELITTTATTTTTTNPPTAESISSVSLLQSSTSAFSTLSPSTRAMTTTLSTSILSQQSDSALIEPTATIAANPSIDPIQVPPSAESVLSLPASSPIPTSHLLPSQLATVPPLSSTSTSSLTDLSPSMNHRSLASGTPVTTAAATNCSPPMNRGVDLQLKSNPLLSHSLRTYQLFSKRPMLSHPSTTAVTPLIAGLNTPGTSSITSMTTTATSSSIVDSLAMLRSSSGTGGNTIGSGGSVLNGLIAQSSMMSTRPSSLSLFTPFRSSAPSSSSTPTPPSTVTPPRSILHDTMNAFRSPGGSTSMSQATSTSISNMPSLESHSSTSSSSVSMTTTTSLVGSTNILTNCANEAMAPATSAPSIMKSNEDEKLKKDTPPSIQVQTVEPTCNGVEAQTALLPLPHS